MRVALGTDAGHAGRSNEDFAAAAPLGAVLVDGAGIPGAGAVCRHGVAWYARRLGGAVLALLDERPLRTVVAEAITTVAESHRGTCAVADAISPSAAVAVVRVAGGVIDYLLLGEATIVIGRPESGPEVVTDLREARVVESFLPALRTAGKGSAEYQRLLQELRSRRNSPGGFWVAKDDPAAAEHAVVGSVQIDGPVEAVLLSNGASRLVDRFGLTDWSGLLTLVAGTDGPGELIRRVRQAENREAVPADDATVVHCHLAGCDRPLG
jgi:hypothetical protein